MTENGIFEISDSKPIEDNGTIKIDNTRKKKSNYNIVYKTQQLNETDLKLFYDEEVNFFQIFESFKILFLRIFFLSF